jgi:hypothetical protein
MSQGNAVSLVVALGIGAWAWIPVLVIVYAVVAKNWLSLLGIPVALLFYNLGYQVSRLFVGSFRWTAFLVALAVLLFGIISDQPVIRFLAAVAVLAWLANSLAGLVAVTALQSAALVDVRLLTKLWAGNSLRVRLASGETYTIGGWRDSRGEFHVNPRS